MRFLLGLTRTLVALSLGLWIGGFLFFGVITAAIMLPTTRKAGIPEIGFQMVGPMMSRFGIICAICSVILVIGWLVDGFLTNRSLWWRLQGAFTVLAIALGAYLNLSLLPAIERDQPAALPLYVRSLQPHPSFSPAEAEIRAHFDGNHQRFTRLVSINVYILIAALACLMAHSLPAEIGRPRAE